MPQNPLNQTELAAISTIKLLANTFKETLSPPTRNHNMYSTISPTLSQTEYSNIQEVTNSIKKKKRKLRTDVILMNMEMGESTMLKRQHEVEDVFAQESCLKKSKINSSVSKDMLQ